VTLFNALGYRPVGARRGAVEHVDDQRGGQANPLAPWPWPPKGAEVRAEPGLADQPEHAGAQLGGPNHRRRFSTRAKNVQTGHRQVAGWPAGGGQVVAALVSRGGSVDWCCVPASTARRRSLACLTRTPASL
jgi:hypothetical protein